MNKNFKPRKKLLNLFLALLITIFSASMTACSEQSTENTTDTNKATTTQQKSIQNQTAAQPQTATQQQNSPYEEVKVTKSIDGDNFEVTHKDGKTTDKVRLIGVNTPESTTEHEKYGQEASDYTKSKLLDKTVYLEKDAGDKDVYSRLLRYVWLEIPKDTSESEIKSKMFNAILAEEGYAQQMTVQPNVKYADYFKKFCAEARTNNKGLWAINSNGTTRGDAIAPAPTSAQTNTSSNSISSNTQPSTSTSSSTVSTTSHETKQYKNAETQATPTAETVYITPTGKKYHRSGCRTIKGSSKAVSRQEAIGEGYDACGVCHP